MKNFLKLFNNSKIKFILILSFLFFIYTTICAFSYASYISQDISNSVFRLHVIANSDSDGDQNLKYMVRDSLLEYMNELCSNCSSKSEAISIAKENINNFKEIALKTIYENGFNYTVNINIGNFEFPTKNYGDISLPAGYYDALRVEIGSAQGQNWWCVMFPPLCFVDVTSGVVPNESKEIIKENLNNDEEYSIISDKEDAGIQFKFSLIEFFKNINFAKASN